MEANAYDHGLKTLERFNDPQLLDAYQRYVARLKTLLTPKDLAIYARAAACTSHQWRSNPRHS